MRLLTGTTGLTPRRPRKLSVFCDISDNLLDAVNSCGVTIPGVISVELTILVMYYTDTTDSNITGGCKRW